MRSISSSEAPASCGGPQAGSRVLSAAIAAIFGQCTGTLNSRRGAIFKRLGVAAWHGEHNWLGNAWLTTKGVYDASHLFLENACTGTRMLIRSCWMSATMLLVSLCMDSVSQAGYTYCTGGIVQEVLYRRYYYMVVHVAAQVRL